MIVDENECSDVSDATAVIFIGVNELIENGIIIYPNPVKDDLTIELNSSSINAQLTIVNELGQVALSLGKSSNTKRTIDCRCLAPGAYSVVMMDK